MGSCGVTFNLVLVDEGVLSGFFLVHSVRFLVNRAEWTIFHMPRTLVKTQVGPPLGLSRRRAEGRACISGPGTPNRNRRPAEGAQSVGSFRSADTGLPAGPHFA